MAGAHRFAAVGILLAASACLLGHAARVDEDHKPQALLLHGDIVTDAHKSVDDLKSEEARLAASLQKTLEAVSSPSFHSESEVKSDPTASLKETTSVQVQGVHSDYNSNKARTVEFVASKVNKISMGSHPKPRKSSLMGSDLSKTALVENSESSDEATSTEDKTSSQHKARVEEKVVPPVPEAISASLKYAAQEADRAVDQLTQEIAETGAERPALDPTSLLSELEVVEPVAARVITAPLEQHASREEDRSSYENLSLSEQYASEARRKAQQASATQAAQEGELSKAFTFDLPDTKGLKI